MEADAPEGVEGSKRSLGPGDVLQAMYPAVQRALATLDGAPEDVALVVLRALGPGTIRALEACGVVREKTRRLSRTRRIYSITPFGREVISVSAYAMRHPGRTVSGGEVRDQLDHLYGALLGEEANLGVVIDIGHHQIRVAAAGPFDDAFEIVEEEMLVDKESRATLAKAAEMVDRAIGAKNAVASQVKGVVVGVPGPVDRATGMILKSPWGSFLRDWDGVVIGKQIAEEIEQRTGRKLEAYVENNVNLRALGEIKAGVGQGHSNVAYVHVDDGVGVGLVLDGKLYRGNRGAAGEFGHIPVHGYPSSYSGPERRRNPAFCERCGQAGCLETLLSEEGLLDELHQHSGGSSNATLEEVAKEARENPAYREIVHRAGTRLGVALTGLALLLDPEQLIIAGPLAEAGDVLVDAVKSQLSQRIGSWTPSVVVAEIADESAIRGGLSILFDETFVRPHQAAGRGGPPS